MDNKNISTVRMLAGLASFFIPGLGQLLLGRFKALIFIIVLGVICWSIGIYELNLALTQNIYNIHLLIAVFSFFIPNICAAYFAANDLSKERKEQLILIREITIDSIFLLPQILIAVIKELLILIKPSFSILKNLKNKKIFLYVIIFISISFISLTTLYFYQNNNTWIGNSIFQGNEPFLKDASSIFQEHETFLKDARQIISYSDSFYYNKPNANDESLFQSTAKAYSAELSMLLRHISQNNKQFDVPTQQTTYNLIKDNVCQLMEVEILRIFGSTETNIVKINAEYIDDQFKNFSENCGRSKIEKIISSDTLKKYMDCINQKTSISHSDCYETIRKDHPSEFGTGYYSKWESALAEIISSYEGRLALIKNNNPSEIKGHLNKSEAVTIQEKILAIDEAIIWLEKKQAHDPSGSNAALKECAAEGKDVSVTLNCMYRILGD